MHFSENATYYILCCIVGLHGLAQAYEFFRPEVTTLLGGMPVKSIGNYFVTFFPKHSALEFIGNYAVCELPMKSIGKCFRY